MLLSVGARVGVMPLRGLRSIALWTMRQQSTKMADLPPLFGERPRHRRTQVLKPLQKEADALHFAPMPADTTTQRREDCRSLSDAPPVTSSTAAVKGFTLVPPANDTPAAIEAAICPLCKQEAPLKGLLQHIFTTHPQVDKEYTRRIVRERYTMLKLSLQKYPPPSPQTGFPCRHCPADCSLYPTLDAVMKHIMESHPDVDVDDEPLPKAITRGSITPSSTTPNAEGVIFTDTHFPCEICRKVFKSEVDLIQHLDTAHVDELAEPLAAEETASHEIRSGLPTYASVQLHGKVRPTQTSEQISKISSYVPTTTGLISVACDLCAKPKVFTSEVALHSHLVAKHPEIEDAAAKVRALLKQNFDAQICPHCCKAFPTHQALLGHMTSKHPGALAVEEVASVVIPASAGTDHQEFIAGGVWWCNDCNRGFKSGSALTGHLTSKHNLPTQSLPCPACRRVFPDVFALRTHVSQAHKNLDETIYDASATHDCPKCPRKFLSSTALAVHTATYHS